MRTLIILVLLLSVAGIAQPVISGEAAGEIDVSENADAKAIQQNLQEIGTNVFPCLIKASGEGKSDAEAEAYCFCKNRSLVESHLMEIKKLRGKHPEWQGKMLKVVSGSPDDRETHRFGDPQIGEIESSLEQASNTCR